jgi:hypothetical protein
MSESAGIVPGSSVIRLRRRSGFYRDRIRTYRVWIDGNPVAEIPHGATKDFPVPPGEHRVRLTIDRFWTSREVMLNAHAGELAELVCRPGGPLPLIMLLIPHSYIRLDGPVAAAQAGT